MFNNKQDVAAQGLPDGFFSSLSPLFLLSKKQRCRNRGPLERGFADLALEGVFFFPFLPLFVNTVQHVSAGRGGVFRGAGSRGGSGRRGAGEALWSVLFAKWLPGRNL